MKIALTGGIAEGKSTVLSYIAEAGIPVESADGIAKRLFSEPYIQRELSTLLGTTMPVSPLDLRAALVASLELRRKVNQVMHPAINALMEASIAKVIEVPLLVEACLVGEFDRVWVVTCGALEQKRRLVARVGDEALADRLIASQLPTSVKAAFADYIIRTNDDESTVKRCVMAAVQRSM